MVTTLIMGLELLTVVNATLCAILGPGLALRGPDGSVHTAVNGMMTHYKFTLACFATGLICFMFSALLYGWMQFEWTLAVPMTVVLAYFLFTIFKYFVRIYRRFRLPPESVVTGAFRAEHTSDAEPLTQQEAAAVAERARMSKQEMQERKEMEATYRSLPEAVRANLDAQDMGMGEEDFAALQQRAQQGQ